MATGFKVADAYVLVRTEDNTRAGRDKIDRDTTNWSRRLGDKAGANIAAGIAKGLLSGLRAMMAAVLRFTVVTSIVGLIGAAVTALTGYIVQLMGAVTVLAQTLWSALGVMALIPGAIATLIGAIATLKIGFSGLGAALKAGLSGDLAAFEEQLSRLAPAAQEVARAIVGMKPAWDALKLSVQQTLLTDVGSMLEALGETYLPILERGLGQVAKGLNSIFGSITMGLLDPYTTRNVEATLGSIGRILENLSSGFAPLIQALSQVVSVSTGILADLSTGWGEVMAGWADAIMRIPEDQWQEWVDNGIAAFRMLGNAIGDVLAIIGGIFKAAGPSDLFGWLDRVRAWVQSFHGQTALSQFFVAMRQAADALSPALFELARGISFLMTVLSGTMVAIGPTLEKLINTLWRALAPLMSRPLADALNAIGEILIRLLDGLSPGAAIVLQAVADGLAALIPVAGPVGQALGRALEALAPLIQALVGPVLGSALLSLARILELMAISLAPVIELFAEFANVILNDLILAQLNSPLFGQIVTMFERFADALRPLIPVAVEFGRQVLEKWLDVMIELQPLIQKALSEALVSVLERLPGLLEKLAPLLPMLVDIAGLLAEEFVEAAEKLIPMLPDLVEAFGDLAVVGAEFLLALIPALPAISDLALLFVRDLLPVLVDAAPVIVELAEAITEVLVAITEKDPRTGYSLLDAFVIGSVLMFEMMTKSGGLKLVLELLGIAFRIVGAEIQKVIFVFQFLMTISQWVRDRFAEFIDWLRDAPKKAGRAVSGVPGAILSALASVPSLMYSAGQAILNGLIQGIASRIWMLQDLLRRITNSIPFWKGPLDLDKRLLVPAGQATLGGYISGIESQVPRLRSLLMSLTEQIPGMGMQPALAGAAGGGDRTVNVAVYIGERPVRDMVQAEIIDQPELVSATAQEGDRRRAFVDPRRRGGGAL